MSELASLNRPPTTREEEAIRNFLQGTLRDSMQLFESILREEPGNLVALSYQGTIQELLAWGINPADASEDFGTVLRLYHEKKYEAAQRWLANLLQSQPNRPEFRTMYLLLSEKILHETGLGSGGFSATSEAPLRSGIIPIADPMARLARWIFTLAGLLLAIQLVIFFVFYPRIKRAETEETKQRLQELIPQEFSPPEIDKVLRYYQIARAYYQEKMYLDALDALKEARRFTDSAKKLEKLLNRLEQQVQVASPLEMGVQLFDAKAYNKAREKFSLVLKIDSSHEGAKDYMTKIEKVLKEQKEKLKKLEQPEEKPKKRPRRRRRRR
ncbi:MAG: hypothetical protein H6728_03390 [Myxococcales bacterium]|nr:hypothetical protein [Myxococcales bacterium]MCB9642094.1 hypothetical protein [Myxococcales bacterium]